VNQPGEGGSVIKRGLIFVDGYGIDVPEEIKSEGGRLKDIVSRDCAGPYQEYLARMYVYLFVEGRTGPRFKFYGIRTEKPKENGGVLLTGAGIYASSAQWTTDIQAYRNFLSTNLEVAVWAMVEKLKKKSLFTDEPKLRQDLLVVANDFLRNNHAPNGPGSEMKAAVLPVDQYGANEETSVVIQYRIEGQGSEADHDKRVSIEDLLSGVLQQSDLGHVDGGDIGNGTANIFCFIKPGQKGTEAIIQTLRKNSYLDGAVIQETVKGEEKVVWPPDYTGEFSVV
jgi:hypothetical protein